MVDKMMKYQKGKKYRLATGHLTKLAPRYKYAVPNYRSGLGDFLEEWGFVNLPLYSERYTKTVGNKQFVLTVVQDYDAANFEFDNQDAFTYGHRWRSKRPAPDNWFQLPRFTLGNWNGVMVEDEVTEFRVVGNLYKWWSLQNLFFDLTPPRKFIFRRDLFYKRNLSFTFKKSFKSDAFLMPTEDYHIMEFRGNLATGAGTFTVPMNRVFCTGLPTSRDSDRHSDITSLQVLRTEEDDQFLIESIALIKLLEEGELRYYCIQVELFVDNIPVAEQYSHSFLDDTTRGSKPDFSYDLDELWGTLRESLNSPHLNQDFIGEIPDWKADGN